MKHKLKTVARASFLSIVIAFGACAPLEGASNRESADLDRWVTQYIDKDEKLLCKREENGEYFFLAQKGEKVKVGSRIDITQTYGEPPKAFIAAWMFRNEKGGHLVTNVVPTAVKEGHVKDDSRVYLEQVEYQTLYLKGSREMHVTIDIKKCPTADCDRQQTKSKDEKQYTIKLCEVPLNEQQSKP